MSNLSRRSALTAIGGAATALPAVAIAACEADAELSRLWLEYQRLDKISRAARDEHKPFRDAADAQRDRLPRGLPFDAWDAAVNQLHSEPNFVRTWQAQTKAWDDIAPLIRAIHNTEARTLSGIGAKLAALPYAAGRDDADFRDAAISVMRDIDRLLGTDFSTRYAEDYSPALANWGLTTDDD